MTDSHKDMTTSAAILCPAVSVSEVIKAKIQGKSMKCIRSEPFPTLQWWRVNQHGCTLRSSYFKWNKVVLLHKYCQNNQMHPVDGHICTLSTFSGQTVFFANLSLNISMQMNPYIFLTAKCTGGHTNWNFSGLKQAFTFNAVHTDANPASSYREVEVGGGGRGENRLKDFKFSFCCSTYSMSACLQGCEGVKTTCRHSSEGVKTAHMHGSEGVTTVCRHGLEEANPLGPRPAAGCPFATKSHTKGSNCVKWSRYTTLKINNKH